MSNRVKKLNLERCLETKWRRIEDNLPEVGQEVIVMIRNASVQTSFYDLEGDGDFDYFDVTHWMPLPDPPNTP